MKLKTIIFLGFILLPLASGQQINVSVDNSCESNEEPLVSLKDTSGGHIGEPGHYSNDICVRGAVDISIQKSCKGTRMFSIADRKNAHFSPYRLYRYDVCSNRLAGEVRKNCLEEGYTTAFSVAKNNNSHAASPGSSEYSKKFCLFRAPPENVTLEVSGLEGEFRADDISISSGETRTLVEYPYVVAENSNRVRGVVGYTNFTRLSRTSSNTVTLTQSGSTFLVPHTEAEVADIENEQDEILSNRFLDSISPSFGFPEPEAPTIRIVRTPDHKVKGFKGTLAGDINLRVKNKGLEASQLVIEIDETLD